MLDIVFLVAAIIGGTVMVCQFLLSLLGWDDGDLDGADADVGDVESGDNHHADSSWLFGVLSFRTLIAAAAFFGISGKAATSAGYPPGMSLVLAIVVGVAAMYGIYWLMVFISRLTSSGNERMDLAVGKHATVYVAIPPQGQGRGKVLLTLQNRTVEYQATTTDNEPLSSGDVVKVVDIKNSNTVEVRRIAEEAEKVT